MSRPRPALLVATLVAVAAVSLAAQDGFKLKSKVELVNVTATVSGEDGHFVPGLHQDDFTIYEDNEKQDIKFFSADRVPVSLGILLDSSGSMTPDKMEAARAAINRFTQELLEPEDELFLMSFSRSSHLLQDWTTDRRLISRAMNRIQADGGTAMYDAIAEAIPLAKKGQHRKKAILVISDGNDTTSLTSAQQLKTIIRDSEVLVYAIGIDASDSGGTSNSGAPYSSAPPPRSAPSKPAPVPSPFPGKAPPAASTPPPAPVPSAPSTRKNTPAASDRVNVEALRRITDDTGGRTEVIVSPRDLDPATAGIADELSRQYFLGYVSSLPKDGRWHAIEVRVKKGNYTIRARKGFVAGT